MAGSKLVRFLLIRNNPSCKTPEADYLMAFLPALEALTSCLAFEEDYPRDFLHTLVVLASSHSSEEDYPRAFLQASEVSHPSTLPKKSTRWPSSRPWKLSLPAWLSKKTSRGSDYSSSGGSRVLMMAFSNSAIPTAPRCIKGLPSIGMKRREGIERIPNRAASSFSSSTLTL